MEQRTKTVFNRYCINMLLSYRFTPFTCNATSVLGMEQHASHGYVFFFFFFSPRGKACSWVQSAVNNIVII